MEAQRSDATSRLPDVVQEFASAVVPALRGGDGRFDVVGTVLTPADDPVAVAAVRVLGADVLAPRTLAGRTPTEADLALFEHAVRAFPPKAGGSALSAWSHRGMRAALAAARADGTARAGDGDVPDTAWVAELSWQRMTHQLAQLAALAVPGLAPPLAEAVAARPVDLARGFVRAVRRRDWLQAAGAGRWLAMTPGTPESLGLATGLDFVHHMGGADARVALHVQAAAVLRSRGDGAATPYAGSVRA
ncbi:hypothetical protein [Streptomyces sp. Z26]|uniref:hypothetical protein n=1 Tax=Streptomyces sp. Z26 TaxID=2500177 RepID=UPI000EF152DF|nr:hypothetical protein [Streptomyces sp. Z26]RLL68016.1 hypothetical protein D7M15_15505 [Streptomyces sp. Z26]